MKPLSEVLLFITVSALALAQQPSTTTVTTNINPSNTYRTTVIYATVRPDRDVNGLLPSGTVTFIDQYEGNPPQVLYVAPRVPYAAIFCVSLTKDGVYGILPPFPAGTHHITAVFHSSDARFADSYGEIYQEVADVSIIWDSLGAVFPTTAIASASVARRFSIFNNSTEVVYLQNLISEGDFVVTSNRCTKGVQPKTHCDVWVNFQPFTAIEWGKSLGRVGKLTFFTSTDSGPSKPMTVPLSGLIQW